MLTREMLWNMKADEVMVVTRGEREIHIYRVYSHKRIYRIVTASGEQLKPVYGHTVVAWYHQGWLFD